MTPEYQNRGKALILTGVENVHVDRHISESKVLKVKTSFLEPSAYCGKYTIPAKWFKEKRNEFQRARRKCEHRRLSGPAWHDSVSRSGGTEVQSASSQGCGINRQRPNLKHRQWRHTVHHPGQASAGTASGDLGKLARAAGRHVCAEVCGDRAGSARRGPAGRGAHRALRIQDSRRIQRVARISNLHSE